MHNFSIFKKNENISKKDMLEKIKQIIDGETKDKITYKTLEKAQCNLAELIKSNENNTETKNLQNISKHLDEKIKQFKDDDNYQFTKGTGD